VTSPQAFEGLRARDRRVRRPDLTVATVDHNVPTTDRQLPIADPVAKRQIEALRRNAAEFGVRLYDVDSAEPGDRSRDRARTWVDAPARPVVCGDSHTSTHGAFGALAFGIGTSEVEHVLATQCLAAVAPRTMRIWSTGALGEGVTAKDLRSP
jgi:3-isopropylmalate/(R)-2-methylmalate dehydratase large subunit